MSAVISSETIDFDTPGTLLEVGSNRPVVLHGGRAWTVSTGRVDVFAVEMRDGVPVGSRRHLFRLEAGRLLVGAGEPGGPDGMGLLAVGASGTRLLEIPLESLRAAAADPARAPAVAALLDEWIDALYSGIAADGVPQECLELEPGEHGPAAAGTRARSGRRVAWLKHDAGASLLLGREELRLNGEGFTPISRRVWLEPRPGARMQLEGTGGLIGGDEAWEGLSRAHALVLRGSALQAGEALAAERARLEQRRRVDLRVLGDACSTIAGTLDPRTGTGGRMRLRPEPGPEADGAEDLLFAACRLVADAQDIPLRRPARGPEGTLSRTPLMALARASRLRTRRVLLRGDWWREDGHPLLAWRGPEERPVALLPDPHGGYRLHDPATRSRERVTEEVAESLSGTACAFYRPFPERPLPLLEVLRFGLHGCRPDLLRVIGMSLAAGLLSLVVPIGTGLVFNDLVPSAERSQLLQLILILLVISVSVALFNLVGAVGLIRIQGKMGSATQAAVWDRLLSLPMPFFRSYSAGDLAVRAMGIDAIRQALSASTVAAILGGIVSLFHLGLLFYYSVPLAGWATLMLSLAVGVSAGVGYLQTRHHRAIAAIRSRIAGTVLQFLSGIAKLRVAGAEAQAFSIWAGSFSEQRRLEYRTRALANGAAAFNAGFPVLSYGVLFAAAMPLLAPGEASLRTGDFLAFTTSFGTCLTGLLAATGALLGMLSIVPMYEQTEPILRAAPEVDTAKADPGVLSGGIEVQHVVFRYRAGAATVLNDLSLRIRPGEFVAFVGPSGSGKSTILRLLLGFESPESGAIYYDGQELSALDIQAVRCQIGVVLQNGRLMSGDLFTNIVGSSTATLEDAWAAARMAGLDADIRYMPMGMHTVVSEGGGTLSGGQRQRLMIARAIVQRPRLLFFDEATSALDNRTQAIVSASLERLQATRIVVAHRLSTVVHADRIFVVDGGAIVQSGSYSELIGSDGLFADLAKRQLA